jgi:signal recognition particle GTPase
MSRTFAELKGKVPGMPSELSAQQITETKTKFAKHEKIVQAMTPEELVDPNLMNMDLKDIENKCPRVQRLSRESGVSEKDVALFIAEFEVRGRTNA